MKKNTFDIKKVEREIELAMKEPHHTPIPPLDDYAPRPLYEESVETIAGVECSVTSRVFKTSSSANDVAMQYEAAAREVEAMGAELKDAAQRAVDMAAKISDALKYIEDTASAYRSEARLIFERIEKVSEMSDAVTRTCAHLKEKMVTDTQLGEDKS